MKKKRPLAAKREGKRGLGLWGKPGRTILGGSHKFLHRGGGKKLSGGGKWVKKRVLTGGGGQNKPSKIVKKRQGIATDTKNKRGE